jgi:hypothetical protein
MENRIDDTSSEFWIDLKDGSEPMRLEATLTTGIDPQYLWDNREYLHLAFKEGERVMANELADPELRHIVVERGKQAIRAIHDNFEDILPFAASASEDGERLVLNLHMLWAQLDEETLRNREVLSINIEEAKAKSEEFTEQLAKDLAEVEAD